ncbi:MAG: enoyl-CoA hydratase/isomerase family protein [Bacteroidales bacterium]|jgi:enoyl-CoA hydratase/carnithine racemase|nr:enoyl-CoA hydratase/isomerase family protein [Bacteroidales bacterium]
MFKVLNWHIKEDIGFLQLNNPPSNQMGNLFFEEFYWWRTEVIDKVDIKAVIIYGSGRHFSSGAVIDDLISIISRSYGQSGDIKKVSEFLNINSQIFYSLKKLDIPVIAAINGVCLGSALELALCADYIICGDKAVLGLPETTFGLMPGCTGTLTLSKLTSKANAIEIILSGNTFNPEKALEYNLINKIVPSKDLLEAAIKTAHDLSIRFTKDLKFV